MRKTPIVSISHRPPKTEQTYSIITKRGVKSRLLSFAIKAFPLITSLRPSQDRHFSDFLAQTSSSRKALLTLE